MKKVFSTSYEEILQLLKLVIQNFMNLSLSILKLFIY